MQFHRLAHAVIMPGNKNVLFQAILIADVNNWGMVMSQLKKLTAASLVMAAATVQAGGSLDLSISDESVRASYDATKVGSGLHVSLDVLHHSDDGDMASVGAHVVDVRDSGSDLYIGVGGKAYGFATRGVKDYSGGGVGLGGFFRYRIPQVPELSVAGYGYYAPPVISISDAENLVDTDIRVQYSLIPTARVYVGYRYTGIKLEKVKDRFELGDGAHLGLKIDF